MGVVKFLLCVFASLACLLQGSEGFAGVLPPLGGFGAVPPMSPLLGAMGIGAFPGEVDVITEQRIIQPPAIGGMIPPIMDFASPFMDMGAMAMGMSPLMSPAMSSFAIPGGLMGIPPLGMGIPPLGMGMAIPPLGFPPMGIPPLAMGMGIPPMGMGIPPLGMGIPPLAMGMAIPPLGMGFPPIGMGMGLGLGMPPMMGAVDTITAGYLPGMGGMLPFNQLLGGFAGPCAAGGFGLPPPMIF